MAPKREFSQADERKMTKNKKETVSKTEKINTTTKEAKEKKPFDKKLYRLKKYSNKYKLAQWEEQRKKMMLRSYKREMDNFTGKYKPFNFDDDDNSAGKFVRHPDLIEKSIDTVDTSIDQSKRNRFAKAKSEYERIKEDKMRRKMAAEKAREERINALNEYRKKKSDRFKILSRKTKKGQPIMAGRIELLLQKIQNK